MQTISCANQNRQVTDIALQSSCYSVLPSDANTPQEKRGLANKLECTLCIKCRCISDADPVNPSTLFMSRTVNLIRITCGGGCVVCVDLWVDFVSVVTYFTSVQNRNSGG
jgi:hypothetical protein